MLYNIYVIFFWRETMYTKESYQNNRQQIKKRLLCCGIPVIVFFVLMIVSFSVRWPEAVTVILSIAAFSSAVFCYSMFVSPVRAYGKHVDHALNGRTRQITGSFLEMEEGAVWRDGVQFYPFTISVGDKKEEENHRLFYMDANFPRPEWKEDDMLLITSYDNRVTAWEYVK